MASQGPLFPGTVTTETGPSGDNDWTNPGNVGADDGAEAQITAATYDAGDHSFRLRASNFGFTIPAGATIDGIVVEIERRDFAGDAQDQEVRLFDSSGTLVGDDKQTATSWPATATIATYGSSSDTWAAGLDAADINSANFGVALIVLANSANTDIGVDFIRVTVHYTGGDVTVTPSPVTIPLVVPTLARVDAVSAYEALIESDGPLAFWRLGEGSGASTAIDEIGGHDGTYQNGAAPTDTGAIVGDPDLAVVLDGSNDFVQVPDHADFDFTTGPLSIEAWVKFNGTNGTFGDTIYGKGTLQTFLLLNTSDVLEFRKADEGTILSGGTISDTDWHHVVVVYENGVTGEIYLDAVAVGGSVTDRTFVANSTAVGLGSKFGSSATDVWHGSLDDIAVYDRILTAQEIEEHYNVGSGLIPVTVTPSPVTIPLAIPDPTVTAGRVVTPSPVTVPLAIPAPTVGAGRVVTPSPVVVPITTVAPTVTAGRVLTPDAVAIPLALPAPSVTVNVLVAPSPVTIPLDLPAPSISAGAGSSDVTVTPDPVALPLAIPSPTVAAGRVVTPSPVAVPLAIPSPTVAVGARVTPSPVTLAIAPVAPAVVVSALVAPSPVVLTFALPAPAVSAGSSAVTITPDPVAVLIAVPAPTIAAGRVLAPSPVLLTLAIPDPTVGAVSLMITGKTRDSNGSPIGNVTVRAYRTSDNVLVAETTSDFTGAFAVPVGTGEHYLVGYKAGSPSDIAGTTVNTLVGS